MNPYVLCLLLTLLAGCAALPTEMRYEEGAWQVLNVADAVTTIRTSVNHPTCYVEKGWWKETVGEHPTERGVILTAAVWGALHYLVTYALVEHDAPRWLVRGFEVVTLGSTAKIVVSNRRIAGNGCQDAP